MRRSPSGPPPVPANGERHDWQTIKKLLPYLWAWKWRVMFALGCLISAKFANVTVPLIFKQIVDGLDISRDQAVIIVPAFMLFIALIIAAGRVQMARQSVDAAAADRRQCAGPADDLVAYEGVNLIDQAGIEEAALDGTAAFDEDAGQPFVVQEL